MPRMQAFAVGVPSTSSNVRGGDHNLRGDPSEPPSAKRKQIETRQRQLDSLKRMEQRYKTLQKQNNDEQAEASLRRKEPKLSLAQPQQPQGASATPARHTCPCHRMSMFVLDIHKAISHHEVEWLEFYSNNSMETPEVAILYSLVHGRGELIIFGGIQKDVAAMTRSQSPENDSVTNALYFLTPPCQVV